MNKLWIGVMWGRGVVCSMFWCLDCFAHMFPASISHIPAPNLGWSWQQTAGKPPVSGKWRAQQILLMEALLTLQQSSWAVITRTITTMCRGDFSYYIQILTHLQSVLEFGSLVPVSKARMWVWECVIKWSSLSAALS